MNTQANGNKKNQNTLSSVCAVESAGRIYNGNKNLSTNAKSKKFAKSKRKSDFGKDNSFETDFFTIGAKKAFIYL